MWLFRGKQVLMETVNTSGEYVFRTVLAAHACADRQGPAVSFCVEASGGHAWPDS